MRGRDVIANVLKKYQAGIISLAFWLYSAWNTVHVSRLIGYVPPRLREVAQARAYAQPYPWDAILATWVLFAVATVGIYYILRTAPYKAVFLGVYAIALFFFIAFFVVVDAGGVYYARLDFPFHALYLAALVAAWDTISWLRVRLRNKQA